MDPILDEVKTLRYQKDDLEKQYEDMKEENKETQQRCSELERKIVHRARLVQTLKNQLEEKEAIIASGLNNNNNENHDINKYSAVSDLIENFQKHHSRVFQI